MSDKGEIKHWSVDSSFKKDTSRKTTIGVRQVAREAGLSTATVSRALNNPQSVSPAKRLRVQSAIEKLNYVPNAAARSLSLSRNQAIGAILPTLDYSIYAQFVEALQSRAGELGYSVLLATHGFNESRELAQARTLIGHGVEALALAGEKHSAELYALLKARQIPYIHTSVFNDRSAHPCVGYDNYQIGRQVTDYLLSLGHRHFSALIGKRSVNDRMVQRITGMRDCLAEKGLSLLEDHIVECPYAIGKAREGLRELRLRSPQATAIICGNDVLAFGAILEAQAMNIRVPGDLSIVGNDDLELASEINPTLTTVQIPVYRMGNETAEALVGRLTKQSPPLHVQIPINLILRQSTGTAPLS
ncbi:MAG: LacI family DNA-binding transcriptional regulator [Pseudomonadota bacterium]